MNSLLQYLIDRNDGNLVENAFKDLNPSTKVQEYRAKIENIFDNYLSNVNLEEIKQNISKFYKVNSQTVNIQSLIKNVLEEQKLNKQETNDILIHLSWAIRFSSTKQVNVQQSKKEGKPFKNNNTELKSTSKSKKQDKPSQDVEQSKNQEKQKEVAKPVKRKVGRSSQTETASKKENSDQNDETQDKTISGNEKNKQIQQLPPASKPEDNKKDNVNVESTQPSDMDKKDPQKSVGDDMTDKTDKSKDNDKEQTNDKPVVSLDYNKDSLCHLIDKTDNLNRLGDLITKRLILLSRFPQEEEIKVSKMNNEYDEGEEEVDESGKKIEINPKDIRKQGDIEDVLDEKAKKEGASKKIPMWVWPTVSIGSALVLLLIVMRITKSTKETKEMSTTQPQSTVQNVQPQQVQQSSTVPESKPDLSTYGQQIFEGVKKHREYDEDGNLILTAQEMAAQRGGA